jgi:hypothetical protein
MVVDNTAGLTELEARAYTASLAAELDAAGLDVDDIVKGYELEAPYAPVTAKESATRQ